MILLEALEGNGIGYILHSTRAANRDGALHDVRAMEGPEAADAVFSLFT